MKRKMAILGFGALAAGAVTLALLLKQKQQELAAANRRLRRQMAESTQAHAHIAQLEAELQAARTASAAPGVDLPQERQARQRLEQQVQRQTEEMDELRAARSTLEQQLKEREAELSSLRDRFRSVEGLPEDEPAVAKAVQAPETISPAKRSFAESALSAQIQPQVLEKPQDLSAVAGIGPVFQQRLYKAGIGTYWELAQLDDDELYAILRPGRTQQTFDLESLRGQAQWLAESTGSTGAIWAAGPVDDFERIKGIGRVYEQRLYDAGIRTYASLAASSVEELAAACQSRAPVPPDFASWIEQAKALLAT